MPLAGGIVFGVLPLLVPVELARATGYAGDEPYVGQLAGAATLGYAVALALELPAARWERLRIVVLAVLVFNVASIYACLVEIATGRGLPIVLLILGTSVAIVLITLALISRHATPRSAPDIAPWLVWVIAVASALAAAFGMLPLLAPELGRGFGFAVTDVFLYRQGGAATLGYAALGVYELRSRRWQELRAPSVMALVFNGASALASVLALAAGDARPLVALIAVAAGGVAILSAVALARGGR